MRDRICFYLNGKRTEACGEDAFLSVADFLRRRRGLTGTKVVCAEGDCGSCAVLIGRPEGDRIRYSAVTSCIQMILQLDGVHIVTIEGLRDGGKLNPIQQAMVSCQGTQCGFCTPGFVVAMQELLSPSPGTPGEGRGEGDFEHPAALPAQNHPHPSPLPEYREREPERAEALRRGLTGNLCRCTGYDSILRAALATDRRALKSMDQLYPPGQMLADLNSLAGQEVRTSTGRFYKPVTIEQAVGFKSEHPTCTVIAGATDLGVVCNKRLREIDIALNLSGIRALRIVRVEPDALCVGAGTTLADLQSLAIKHLPELGRFMERFGSPLVRNAGTLGGNIVTGSPIGDTIPALMALGATLEITGLAGARSVPISQFYSGYRKTVLAPDELVSSVRIPRLKSGETIKLYKVSRRKDLDISSFGAAIWMRQSDGIIQDIRLTFGGVGPMVLRMEKTQTFLRGQAPSLELFEQAGKMARKEVMPISDVRGSAEYRRTLAENILPKFWHEVFGTRTAERVPGSNGVF